MADLPPHTPLGVPDDESSDRDAGRTTDADARLEALLAKTSTPPKTLDLATATKMVSVAERRSLERATRLAARAEEREVEAEVEAESLLDDARREADELIRDARARAVPIIEAAGVERDRLLDQARVDAEAIIAEAQRGAERARRDAEAEAEQLAARGRSEGDRQLSDALRESASIRQSAEATARELLDLAEVTATMLDELETRREHLIASLADLTTSAPDGRRDRTAGDHSSDRAQSLPRGDDR